MARYKTFVNGGTLLPGDLNAIEDDYEYGFSTYKTVCDLEGNYRFDAVTAATYLLSGQGGTGGAGLSASNALAGNSVVYFDPADWTANTRATKLRIRAVAASNNTAIGAVTATVGLYPVSAVTGAGAAQVTATLGAVVTGSTVAFASPAASTLLQGNSGDFVAPAAGYYAIAVAFSANAAASSSLAISARMQMRQV